MAKKQIFEARLISMPRGGVGFEIPFSVSEVYDTRGRLKIKAKFDGYPYRGSIAPMGGRHILGVTKEIRRAISKGAGDIIKVEIEEDKEPRIVNVPDDFKKALSKNKRANEVFDNFAYTHRKEYVRWIDEAKKSETRERRIVKAVQMISQGQKFS